MSDIELIVIIGVSWWEIKIVSYDLQTGAIARQPTINVWKKSVDFQRIFTFSTTRIYLKLAFRPTAVKLDSGDMKGDFDVVWGGSFSALHPSWGVHKLDAQRLVQLANTGRMADRRTAKTAITTKMWTPVLFCLLSFESDYFPSFCPKQPVRCLFPPMPRGAWQQTGVERVPPLQRALCVCTHSFPASTWHADSALIGCSLSLCHTNHSL